MSAPRDATRVLAGCPCSGCDATRVLADVEAELDGQISLITGVLDYHVEAVGRALDAKRHWQAMELAAQAARCEYALIALTAVRRAARGGRDGGGE